MDGVGGLLSWNFGGFLLVKRLGMDPISQHSKTHLDPNRTSLENIILRFES